MKDGFMNLLFWKWFWEWYFNNTTINWYWNIEFLGVTNTYTMCATKTKYIYEILSIENENVNLHFMSYNVILLFIYFTLVLFANCKYWCVIPSNTHILKRITKFRKRVSCHPWQMGFADTTRLICSGACQASF